MFRVLSIKKIILCSAMLTITSTACNVPVQLTQPSVITDLPATYYQARTDSNSIGATPWKLFFTDPILQQLIDTAITKNIDLLSVDQQIQISGTSLFLSKALTLPTLDAVINAQADRYAFYTINGIGNYDLNKSNNITKDMRIPSMVPDLMVGFRSQWEIDVWGKLKNMKKSAHAKYLASIQGKLFLQTNIVAEVAYHYYELLGLDYEIDIVRKNILLQQDALEIVKAQKLGGRVTELAVKQFEALVYRTKAIEFGVKQQIAETENKLNLLLGRYPQTILRGQG